MLLILVFILIVIWATVVGSIYANFIVFYSNFSESENYHKAYYNAISALERAELVTKQRSPWYIWSGWWKIDEIGWTWSRNWWWSDSIIEDFSYLSSSGVSENTSSIFWSIKSRTTRIPAEWEWDVEITLAAPDSSDYNMMDYEDAQIFLLYYDDAEWNPYKKISCKTWACTLSAPTSISWRIRLPQLLGFDQLNTTNSLVWTWPGNDAIVDWQVRWKYYEQPFTIYSRQNIAWKVIYSNSESAFREDAINNILNFTFSSNKWNPIRNTANDTASIIIISPKESEIRDLSHKYTDIFSNSQNPQLRFSLLNLLKDTNNKLYPFLEYYADFWTDVADKYFTINAEWNYADYQVNILMWKPTNKESVLWNFSSIF